ncbi:hypothetical protein JCM11251_001140 [Rhodosporidiobolus azoricus]
MRLLSLFSPRIIVLVALAFASIVSAEAKGKVAVLMDQQIEADSSVMISWTGGIAPYIIKLYIADKVVSTSENIQSTQVQWRASTEVVKVGDVIKVRIISSDGDTTITDGSEVVKDKGKTSGSSGSSGHSSSDEDDEQHGYGSGEDDDYMSGHLGATGLYGKTAYQEMDDPNATQPTGGGGSQGTLTFQTGDENTLMSGGGEEEDMMTTGGGGLASGLGASGMGGTLLDSRPSVTGLPGSGLATGPSTVASAGAIASAAISTAAVGRSSVGATGGSGSSSASAASSSSSSSTSSSDDDEAGMSTTAKIAIGVVVVLVLAACGGGLWYWQHQKKKSADQNANDPESAGAGPVGRKSKKRSNKHRDDDSQDQGASDEEKLVGVDGGGAV